MYRAIGSRGDDSLGIGHLTVLVEALLVNAAIVVPGDDPAAIAQAGYAWKVVGDDGGEGDIIGDGIAIRIEASLVESGAESLAR